MVHDAQPPTQSETVPIAEATARLGIARHTGYRWQREGIYPLRVIKLNRKLVVNRRELEALLNGNGGDGSPRDDGR